MLKDESGVHFRNHALDGLRGYAAIAVIFFHTITGFNMELVGRAFIAPFQTIQNSYDFVAKIVLMIFNGHSAVDLFFVLSGCVLITSIERLLARGPIPNAILVFVVKRTLRIMPTLMVCVAVIALIIWVISISDPEIVKSYRWVEIRDNLFLRRTSVNGASWTLRIEMLAIVPMIIAGLLNRALGVEGLIAFLFFSVLATENPWLVFGFNDLAGHLFYFALGALIPTRLGIKSSSINYGLIPLLLTFLFVRAFFSYDGLAPRIVNGAACYFIVAKVFYNGFPKLNGLLILPISRYLGKMSYSIYLWNVLILNVIYAYRPILPSWLHDNAVLAGLLSGAPICALTIVIAHFSEKYIERPSVRLGNSFQASFKFGRLTEPGSMGPS